MVLINILQIEPVLNTPWNITDEVGGDYPDERYPAEGYVDLIFTTDTKNLIPSEVKGFKVYFSKGIIIE